MNHISLERNQHVIGSGPIRIGQGVEFDYATAHCVKHYKMGEAIVINSNPETASTDFSISDELYWTLTLEDVLNVCDLEKPEGAIVHLGSINLAAGLENMGVKILERQLKILTVQKIVNLFDQITKSFHINRKGLNCNAWWRNKAAEELDTQS